MANPNPSPETRWKPGQSGNPSGRSSEELRNMNEAARIASELTLKALSSLQEKLNTGAEITDADLALLLGSDTRGMIAEAQNRAHGTPAQSIAHTSPDGSMTPRTLDLSGLPADVLAALVDLADGQPDDE